MDYYKIKDKVQVYLAIESKMNGTTELDWVDAYAAELDKEFEALAELVGDREHAIDIINRYSENPRAACEYLQTVAA